MNRRSKDSRSTSNGCRALDGTVIIRKLTIKKYRRVSSPTAPMSITPTSVGRSRERTVVHLASKIFDKITSVTSSCEFGRFWLLAAACVCDGSSPADNKPPSQIALLSNSVRRANLLSIRHLQASQQAHIARSAANALLGRAVRPGCGRKFQPLLLELLARVLFIPDAALILRPSVQSVCCREIEPARSRHIKVRRAIGDHY